MYNVYIVQALNHATFFSCASIALLGHCEYKIVDSSPLPNLNSKHFASFEPFRHTVLRHFPSIAETWKFKFKFKLFQCSVSASILCDTVYNIVPVKSKMNTECFIHYA